MSRAVEAQAPVRSAQTPEVTPLSDAAWEAWIAKGRLREQRIAAIQSQVARWGSVAALLVAAVLGPNLTPYDVVVRFVATAASVACMIQMLQRRKFAFAAGFTLLALVYNPLAPTFSFAGTWGRLFLVASAIPFIAPLVWSTKREPRHV